MKTNPPSKFIFMIQFVMTYLWTDLICGLLNRPQVDTLANSARVEKIISLSLDRMKLISIALSTVWKFNGVVRIISYKPHKLSPLLSMRMIGSTLYLELTFQTCVKQYQKWLICNKKKQLRQKLASFVFKIENPNKICISYTPNW